MNTIIVVTILIGIVLISTIMILKRRKRKKEFEQERRSRWKVVAQNNGYEFFEECGKDRNEKIFFKQFKEISWLYHQAFNISVKRVEGLTIRIFDYLALGGSKESFEERWHIETDCFLTKEEMALHEFIIRPASGGALSGLFGSEDGIVFDNDKEFSDNFYLDGDEWSLRRLFDTSVRQYFLLHRNIVDRVHYKNRTLMVSPGKILEPEKSMDLIDFSKELLMVLEEANRKS